MYEEKITIVRCKKYSLDSNVKNNTSVSKQDSNKLVNPVNKSLSDLIKKKRRKKMDDKVQLYKNIHPTSVSIITATRKPKYIDNVFENYERQNYDNKELIIVLNNNSIDIEEWEKKASQYNYVKVFQLDESKNLSECLNFGIEHTKYEIIAKFDDDDYYGPNYLKDSIKAFKNKYAGIVGKAKIYIYFEDSKILAIRNDGRKENHYVTVIADATMLIRREVLDIVKFDENIENSVGIKFCKDCKKHGIRTYATDRKNFVARRHECMDDHMWLIQKQELLNQCLIISETEDFTEIVNS
ncbi:glycosyltransferase [Brassicibacter mesophilus]|uniref:glycosyltransferase n=1 Tax=Brassicibacter mesophilus TaxID=745119 RepID=UPI003D1B12DB